MNTDYYKVLGVSEDATADEIKQSYRKLAKKYHPDRHHGDDAAETKFKEISEANAVLSDPQKRQEYDTIRKYGGFAPGGAGPGFGTRGAPGSGGAGLNGFDFSHFERGSDGSFHFSGNIEDILGDLFGGSRRGSRFGDPFGGSRHTARRQSAPPAGSDLKATITITLAEAVNGTKKLIKLGSGKKIRVTIPAGIENGKVIRLTGQGEPSEYGGKNGNLNITVRVIADKQFTRKGNDIHTHVEIGFNEAILGCKKTVKTLTKSVAITIPPGTQPGAKLRLKGIGLDVGSKKGDLFVEVRVKIPTELTEKQKKLLNEWGE